MQTHWKDCQEWIKFGLPLPTTSNEVCKLYDAALIQMSGFYDDKSVGGIEGCIKQMKEADPNFILAHVMESGSNIVGTGLNVSLRPDIAAPLSTMLKLADNPNISEWEKKHIRAVKLWADGFEYDAVALWEVILLEHPLDMMASRHVFFGYLFLGLQQQMRDTFAQILPHWKTTDPLYGSLLGLYAFGLCETNFYSAAEKLARKGLELNRHDPWSTHTVAHVMEMEGRYEEGICFMNDTVADWTVGKHLACHNFWHLGLNHIEKGDYHGAIDIFDSELLPRQKSLFNVTDGAALLLRLEMEGLDVGNRWKDMYEHSKPYQDDHVLVWDDLYMIMCSLGAKEEETTQKIMDALREYVKNGCGDNHTITKEVGMPICEALVAYDEGDYGKAVDLVLPIRYKIVRLGGSNAQRDLFNLFLISAALKSSKPIHRKLAKSLLVERKALKENSPMTDRLLSRAIAVHDD